MTRLEAAYSGLMTWMVQHPHETLAMRQSMQATLLKRRCIQGDVAIPTALMPLFLKPSSMNRIREAAETLDSVVDRAIDLMVGDASLRRAIPEHLDIPQSWINAGSTYQKATVLNRLDVLFDGTSLKFIEFNTDNPGGRGWVDVITATFAEQEIYRDLIELTIPVDRPILSELFRAVMSNYGETGSEGTPRVALMSFETLGTRGDDEIVRDYFIERGVPANLVDPRDFELHDDALWANGVRFDILVRGMTAPFFLRYPREMAAFIDGVKAQSASLFNSFKATIGSQKALLAFLTNPLNHHYFTAQQVKAINDHIPWTRRFDETVTLSPAGEEVSIKSYMLSHREELVIKPSSGAGGEGVMVGASTDAMEWFEIIEDYVGCPDWVVQSYVPIPQIELPIVRGADVVVEKRYFNLSPYVFGGKMAGILGRISSSDVVNVHTGGGLIPVFALRDEQV